jgi:hypothetical protein
MLEAYKQAGGRPDILQTPRVASVVISGNRVLALNLVEGVEIEAEELEDGVRARIVVAPGTVVDYPVHLCFGMVSEEGLQRILPESALDRARRCVTVRVIIMALWVVSRCYLPHPLI